MSSTVEPEPVICSGWSCNQSSARSSFMRCTAISLAMNSSVSPLSFSSLIVRVSLAHLRWSTLAREKAKSWSRRVLVVSVPTRCTFWPSDSKPTANLLSRVVLPIPDAASIRVTPWVDRPAKSWWLSHAGIPVRMYLSTLPTASSNSESFKPSMTWPLVFNEWSFTSIRDGISEVAAVRASVSLVSSFSAVRDSLRCRLNLSLRRRTWSRCLAMSIPLSENSGSDETYVMPPYISLLSTVRSSAQTDAMSSVFPALYLRFNNLISSECLLSRKCDGSKSKVAR